MLHLKVGRATWGLGAVMTLVVVLLSWVRT